MSKKKEYFLVTKHWLVRASDMEAAELQKSPGNSYHSSVTRLEKLNPESIEYLKRDGAALIEETINYVESLRKRRRTN